MNHLWLPILLALALLSPGARAQSAAERALDTLLAHFDPGDPRLSGLREAVLHEFGPDIAYDPEQRNYTVYHCEAVGMSARAVDLNGDDIPEVEVWGGGTCLGGRSGMHNWVFIRPTLSSPWRVNLDFNAGLAPLSTRSHGFVDVITRGPGFCHGVWRWNGNAYTHRCNAAEGSVDCHTPCPRSMDGRVAGQSLPLFVPIGTGTPPTRLVASSGSAPGIAGALDTSDPTLSPGRNYDAYAFEARAGDRIEVDLTDGGFYAYVELKSPSGLAENTTDYDRETYSSSDHARLDLQASEAGTWRLFVTSAHGETGEYELDVRVGGTSLAVAEPTCSPEPSGAVNETVTGTTSPVTDDSVPASFPAPVVLRESGRLERGDTRLSSGEFYDTYTVEVAAGDGIEADLRSSDFDPYLVLKAPSGSTEYNGDLDGSSSRAFLRVRASESGTWQVFATSAQPGVSGPYTLEVRRERSGR